MAFAQRFKQPLKNMGTPEHGQETETDVVWLHLKVFWHSKEYLQGALKEKREIDRRGGKTKRKHG